MKSIQMSRQVNLYLTQDDIEKIQKYLRDRNFIFLGDEILEVPKPIYANYLFQYPQMADYVCFSNVELDYRQFFLKGMLKFRIRGMSAELIDFSFLGEKEGIYRVRFYYCPYYFENHEKKFKNPEFGLHVERFFRWLRRTFVRVPNMPTFYQNPNFPVKEAF